MTILEALPGTGIASGFADLGAHLEANPALAARMPGRRIVNIPLNGETPDERLAELHDIAREMGTVVEWHGPGFFEAAIHFGGVTLEAHYTPGQTIAGSDAWSAASDDDGLAVTRRDAA